MEISQFYNCYIFREKVKVHGFGLFVFVIYPGAFVELDTEQLMVINGTFRLKSCINTLLIIFQHAFSLRLSLVCNTSPTTQDLLCRGVAQFCHRFGGCLFLAWHAIPASVHPLARCLRNFSSQGSSFNVTSQSCDLRVIYMTQDVFARVLWQTAFGVWLWEIK